MGKKTHMTDKERSCILAGIIAGKNFREIADEIGKSQSTVSREILKHRYAEKTGCIGKRFNDCRKRKRCPVSKGCPKKDCSRMSCSSCEKLCNSRCPEYEKEECAKLKRPPYVCGVCSSRSKCQLEKMYYSPVIAQKEYADLLSFSRQALHCSEDDIDFMDHTLSKGLAKGQSINHIYSYTGKSMPVSQRTAYKYINNGVFPNAIRLSQPKAVTMKPRKAKKSSCTKEEKERFIGRTYPDYNIFIAENPSVHTVEMDCIEGKRKGSGKVLLTLLFNPSNLQIAFVLDNKDTQHVHACLEKLRKDIGNDMYKRLFPVILTDRGSEFSDVKALEMDENGELLSRVFYCDPDSPRQKGRCERNHADVRRILRKGTDINLSQEAVSLMMNNINSMPRPQYRNKSSYDMFVFYYGQDAAEALGLVKIHTQDITLTPALLG